jgi:hypothetical protein
MAAKQESISDRRRCLRHKVHTPAFASFDGVTGGMILDLSEQGMSMQTEAFFEPQRRLQLALNLPDPSLYLETTGYVAWADALGRAGVRFSDLPADARRRLNDWLSHHDSAPSRKAPVLSVSKSLMSARASGTNAKREALEFSLESETNHFGEPVRAPLSTTAQYEFSSLGPDLTSALRYIGERARSLTRGTGAAIALEYNGTMLCRASIGANAPSLGSRLDVNSGISGECVRSGRALRCDDAENDPRVDVESCRLLGVRSILAAPVRYERDIVGLLEVFSSQSFAFDEGDVAVAERLAQTVVLAMSQMALTPKSS